MNRFFCLLLLSTSFLSAGEIIPYSPQGYTPKNSLTSHFIAGGREVSALVQKMRAHVQEEPEKNTSKKAVLLIHGLNSSPKDWHLVIQDLKTDDYEVYTIYLSYWKKDGFATSVEKIQEKALAILQNHGTLDIIGHSLGGVAAVQAVNELGIQQRQVSRLITVNSPLNGTTVMNRLTRLFIPNHLIEVLSYEGPFVQNLREQSLQTHQAGVRFFHTAAESDHLVRGVNACFLPQFEEGVVVTDEGHLSTLNSKEVREKIKEWLIQ